MRLRRILPILGVAALLGGCSFAPDDSVPATVTPVAFKETGASGLWTTATPQDTLPRGAWWTLYRDATLNGLEEKLDAANPGLAAALDRYDQALAYVGEAEASEFPVIGAEANPTRNRQSDNRPLRGANQPDIYTSDTIGASLNYEFDLWGAVRNAVAAGKANAQSVADQWGAIKLSLEAALADDYIKMRGLDDQEALLNATVTAYTRAYNVTAQRHSGGIASGLDESRAQAQLADAQAQSKALTGQRALYEHAVATLIGAPASNFSLVAQAGQLHLPNVPAGLPSTLLQRRPDIAAAEREVAARNAEIGVANAAYYPAITLGGAIGFQDTGGAGLLTAPNLFWSLGPDIAALLFDGGRRDAQVKLAQAEKNEAADAYRGQVLAAFQDVEDNLALLNSLAAAAADQANAVQFATRAEQLSTARYELGIVNYLDVVTAQTAALLAQQKALDLDTSRFEASIRLIKALGGGWTADDAAKLALAAASAADATGSAARP